MMYCLSNEKVCYLGHYPGCLFINQWNSEKCGTIVRIQRLTRKKIFSVHIRYMSVLINRVYKHFEVKDLC